MAGRQLGQLFDQGPCLLRLRDRLAAVQQRARSAGAGIGAQQQAVSRAQRRGRTGGKFGTVTALGEAGVVGLLLEVAELQAAGVLVLPSSMRAWPGLSSKTS